MYIAPQTVTTAWQVTIAVMGLIGLILAVYKWYLKQGDNQKKIETLERKHNEDIKKIEEEACLHTYGILACLKGLQEKGCNGPVTEAIDKFEKYINKRAHDQEE